MAIDKSKQNLRICLVSISLGTGGAERSTALLSKMLTQVGFSVTTVILTDRIDYDYSGSLFNLGLLKNETDTFLKRLQRFHKLRKYLKKQQFDLILDNRTKQFWKKELFYLYYLYTGQRLVYLVRSYNKENYLSDKDFVTRKMLARTQAIISVSKEIAADRNQEFHTQHFQAIYNPIEVLNTKKPNAWTLNTPYILFLGRIEVEVKNLDLLLKAYKQSGLVALGIPLVLMGDGELDKVQGLVKELELVDWVKYLAFTADVGWVLQNAKYLVLSSQYEGFPRVLIEALSVGTPVVSVDCKTGPKEIIQDEKNGLLVPNHDVNALAKAMHRMCVEEDLYKACKAFAKQSVAHLSQEKIAEQWREKLLEIYRS